MIQITQMKLPPDHTRQDMKQKIARLLKVAETEITEFEVIRRSVDARKKPELFFVYTVWVTVKRERTVIRKAGNRNITQITPVYYQLPASKLSNVPPASLTGSSKAGQCGGRRPVVVGSGPAGLFCGLSLARQGLCPLILERGRAVEERVRDVEAFWQGGPLDPESNVQFGEGGAGTFSDGKLNTLVKDPEGRGRAVLQIFVAAGADPDILYMQKPHIGTDVLRDVVRQIRNEILSLGGEIRFRACVTDLLTENGRLTGLKINGQEYLETRTAVLAIGHSARDTFEMLYRRRIPMEAKAFAVGLRIEHPQSMIEMARYGAHPYGNLLPVADYKVTHRTANGRGVYSFCMCPGGYVVNASSEAGRLAVNGMSFRDRGGKNANSALIVTVTPEDFAAERPDCPVLSGVAFQRRLEEQAYRLCQGRIPVQLFGDFESGRASRSLGEVAPQMKGSFCLTDLRSILPDYISAALVEGVHAFDRQIAGFARPDALFSGIESRTSSPVKILRGRQCESALTGLYPCGEGAGYAGGIVSAAMDGLRVAEQIGREAHKDT